MKHLGARVDPAELEASIVAGEFPPEVRAELQRAFKARAESEGAISIERALRLPCGDRRRQLARNGHLRRAYALCRSETSRARAQDLEREIRAFFRVVQHVAADGTLAGKALSELRAALLAAYRQGAGLPSSWRHLLRICDTESPNVSRAQVDAPNIPALEPAKEPTT